MEKLIAIINTVLKNRGKYEISNIKETSHLRNDLGFDSLDLAELTVRIDAEFEMDINWRWERTGLDGKIY